MEKKLIIICTGVAVLLSAACALGADRYVSPPGGYGTNNPPYTNWADAATNIQWAVDASSGGDTIWVTNGTYNLTNQIRIIKSITLKSVNGTNFAFINGNYPAYTNRCLYITNGTTVSGFTISNGFSSGAANEGGGGVFLNRGGLVTNCLIIRNAVSNDYDYSGGGGVYAWQGGTVTHCAIVSNTVLNSTSASYNRMGGGFYANYGGTATGCVFSGNAADNEGGGAFLFIDGIAVNCVFSGNRAVAGKGGGVYPFSTGSKVESCTIMGNTAVNGGGVCLVGENARLADSIICSNVAGWGGAVHIEYGGQVTNCTINNNVSSNYGGAMYLQGDWGFYRIEKCRILANTALNGRGGGIWATKTGLIRNCVIYANTNRLQQGGGLFLNEAAKATNYPSGVINCTIAANETAVQGGGLYLSGTNHIIENCVIFSNISTNDANDEIYHADSFNTNNYTYTCVPVALAPNQGNITNDPLFIAPGENNYRLSHNSPCVNTGTNRDWMTNSFDLDGLIRIRYDRVDMGAYELIYNAFIGKVW